MKLKFVIAAAVLVFNLGVAMAQTTSRQLILTELRSTHDQAGWFAPLNAAIDGMTAKQASWKPGPDIHSVGELVHHLLYWNQQQLKSFKGQPKGEQIKSNDETFDKFQEANWDQLCSQLKTVMEGFESWVKTASDAELNAKMEV